MFSIIIDGDDDDDDGNDDNDDVGVERDEYDNITLISSYELVIFAKNS